ncbi:lysine--tRNA ligase, partial [Candidatus Dojkabacteria bacterium]|nr:lysine--tRNA ligase [Candidatus Dojkabacteria bacterium]
MARQAKSDLIGQRQLRIDKIAQLKKLGIDPFPSKSYRTNLADEISNNYSAFENQEATVAGRLMTLRRHGAISFGNIQDSSGSIQLYIKEDSLNKTSTQKGNLGYDLLDMLDLGDIVEAKGKVVKTKTGEISIEAESIRLLTKAIRPLPEKWAGLKDKETIYRKRYLDLIMDPSKKVNFQKSAELLFAIREFMNSKGFLEIKTPILQPVYGGTSAKPFSTHVNSLDKDFYLAVSHELYLKRLITAGFDNVYNIAGYFRNEGIDRTHNPEFTMLETMTAFQNYEYNMDLIEEMYLYLGKKVFGRTVFKICGQDIDFSKPWERIRMIDAVKKYSNYDFNSIKSLEDAHKALDEIGYKEDRPSTIAECMVKVFEEKVEEQLIQPTFVYGHPVEVSPLAKS